LTSRFEGYFTVVALSLFWGLGFVAVKSSLEVLSPVAITFLRLVLSSISFLLFLALGMRDRRVPEVKDLPAIGLLGFLGFTATNLCYSFGQQFATTGFASLIVALTPVFIAVFSVFLLKESMTLTRGAGVAVAFLGVILLVFLGHESPTVELTEVFGAGILLLTSIAGALHTVLGKTLLRRYTPTALVAWALPFGTAFALPFVSPGDIHQILKLSATGWLPILFLALFSTFLAYVLWYRLLARAEASATGAYLYLSTLTAIIGGIVFLGEVIAPSTVIGGSLVLVGVVMTQRAHSRL
jgi:drug/metabolite transporter (DMT)-like permease